MKEALRESLKEHAMKQYVDSTNGEGLNIFYSNACYSCGEEGHFSQYCTKERKEYLGYFPTTEVKFDPREIEALIITEKTRKGKRRQPQNNTIFTEKDLSHITCYRCKDLSHYASQCPEKKPRIQGAYIITKKPRDMSEFICFRCKEPGHLARECSDQMKAGAE